MANCALENELGCGFIGGIFQRRSFLSRKAPVHSLPSDNSKNALKLPTTHNSKKPRGSSSDVALLDSSSLVKPRPKQDEKTSTKPILVCPRPSTSIHQNQVKRHSDATRSSTSSSNSSSLTKVAQIQDLTDLNRLKTELSGIPTNLNRIVKDHHQSNVSDQALVHSASGNVMLLGHLGNLRQPGAGNSRSAQEASSMLNYKNGSNKLGSNGTMGNIVRKPSYENPWSGNWHRGLMNKRDPEVLKCMGNEEYKLGRFEEALALYNQAIALDSSKASYHSNKAAALMGLGRLIEAVSECREALRIEPHYHRAHHRLATLYLRLGEAEKALCHYKYSCPKADSEYIAQAQALQMSLSRCIEAQKLRDWNTLLKEAQCAKSSGSDSAPKIYALQAEALLKLHRHEEAYAIFCKGPNFDINSCTEFFGPDCGAYILRIQSQLYMAMGRLEDAVDTAQHAARLDLTNKEVNAVLRRARAVASARLRGNKLFKACKFSEARVVYSEGLEHDPCNSVLLCNRAACRSKLAQFEKAVEDCTAALNVRPSYSKARLRRADCNAKLERWEASIQDYEMLIRETPGDEGVGRALFEAQVQLKKQRGEDIMEFGSNLFLVTSNERFRHFVTSPGMSVVLFCTKTCHKQVLLLLEQVCRRFPSINFLKVDVVDHPYLAKSESVNSTPAFKIYKNGSMVKEIPGKNGELLEPLVKMYTS